MKSKLVIFVVLISIFMFSYQSFAIELEKSIDGPANTSFFLFNNVMAWTDLNNRINVRVFYNNGLSTRIVLNETSNYKPSITRDPECRIVLAWTGTDSRINIMYLTDELKYVKKWVLEESSICAPCVYGGLSELLLAWTGTNKQINIDKLNISTITGDAKLEQSEKNTLSETSSYSPAITHDNPKNYSSKSFYLAWTGLDKKINYIISDSANFKSIKTKKTTKFLSNTAPALSFIMGDTNGAIIGWSGTNNNLSTLKIDYLGNSSEYRSYDSYLSLYSPSLYANYIEGKHYMAWTSKSNSRINLEPILGDY